MHAELQLDNQICFRLYTAARLITQAYTPMLTELGITYPQYLVNKHRYALASAYGETWYRGSQAWQGG